MLAPSTTARLELRAKCSIIGPVNLWKDCSLRRSVSSLSSDRRTKGSPVTSSNPALRGGLYERL